MVAAGTGVERAAARTQRAVWRRWVHSGKEAGLRRRGQWKQGGIEREGWRPWPATGSRSAVRMTGVATGVRAWADGGHGGGRGRARRRAWKGATGV